jgi:protein O-mannosyl-transferase
MKPRDMICGLLLLAVTFAAYKPAWNGGLLWDDSGHITKPELRSVNGLARIWTEPGATQQYYPLVHSVFWLEYRLWGGSTTGYHLLNIFLHVLSALLLLLIMRHLEIPGAWFIAALFALHPVMVESVAWITELKNTLSGVFFFGTALAYLKFEGKREKKRYALAVGLFVLGLFSKSAIATLPVSLLAVAWWKRGTIGWRRDVFPLLPFFALGVASGLFTAHRETVQIIGWRGDEFDFSVIERCLIAGRAFWFYLGKIVWPVNLMFIYPRWNVDAAVWWQYLFPAAGLGCAAVLWALRKRTRAPFAVFACCAAGLFPVLGFFNVYPFRFSFVADHFQYLACAAPLVLAAAGANSVFCFVNNNAARFLRPAAAGGLLGALALLTWQQSAGYADAEGLYRTTLLKNDACWMAHNNLGILLAGEGRTGEAEFHYRSALHINPGLAEAASNLGALLVTTGRREEAEASFRKALAISPHYGRAHYNLGGLLAADGRTAEAADHLRQALETGPDGAPSLNEKECVDAFYRLGNVLLQEGRTGEAIGCYRKALEIDPGHLDARYNLGNALLRAGQPDEAISCYLKVVEINPGHADALNNLALALQHKGQHVEAVRFLERALAAAKAAGQEERAGIIQGDLEKLLQEYGHE